MEIPVLVGVLVGLGGVLLYLADLGHRAGSSLRWRRRRGDYVSPSTLRYLGEPYGRRNRLSEKRVEQGGTDAR